MSFGKGGSYVMTETGELVEEGALIAAPTPTPTPAPAPTTALTMAELDAGVAADIIAAIPTLTHAQLLELQTLELAGKNRITVMDALAAQIALLG